jgi:hypothetical protein
VTQICIIEKYYIMKAINLLFISLLIVSRAFSQNTGAGNMADSSAITYPSTTGLINNSNAVSPDKMHLSFETGVDVFSMGKQSAFDNWYAPALTYNVTPRFQITAGAIALYSKNNFQSSINSEGINTFPQNTGTGQYFLFAKGSYSLNSRLTLSGTLLREVPDSQINPSAMSITHVNVAYKITDAFSVSAGCTVVKGNNSSFMGGYNGFNPSFPISGGFASGTW